MRITFQYSDDTFSADLSKPLDVSVPLREGAASPNCFYAPLMEVYPVVAGDFIGSTKEGGPVNFMNVKINPHGNGTHTECVGHIATQPFSINKTLKKFHFVGRLISVYPRKQDNGDRVIMKNQLEDAFRELPLEALIIRTLPNDEKKLSRNYSGTNPPYMHFEAAEFLAEKDLQHLIVDLPSVDREEDEGKLLAHHHYWKYPEDVRKSATISELVYVNNEIKDGLYLVNIQIASFEIDVSPSKIVLYPLVQD